MCGDWETGKWCLSLLNKYMHRGQLRITTTAYFQEVEMSSLAACSGMRNRDVFRAGVIGPVRRVSLVCLGGAWGGCFSLSQGFTNSLITSKHFVLPSVPY